MLTCSGTSDTGQCQRWGRTDWGPLAWAYVPVMKVALWQIHCYCSTAVMALQSLCAVWIPHQESSAMSKAVIWLLSISAVVWKTLCCAQRMGKKEKKRWKREENRLRCQTAERGIVDKAIILELFIFFFLSSTSPDLVTKITTVLRLINLSLFSCGCQVC